MGVSEFAFVLAMFHICVVSLVWLVKQILILCCWYYKEQMKRLDADG